MVFDQLKYINQNFNPFSISTISKGCEHGSLKVLKELCDRGISINNETLVSLLGTAVKFEIIQGLFSKIIEKEVCSIFNHAIKYGHVEFAAYLLKTFPQQFDEFHFKRSLDLAVKHCQVASLIFLYPFAQKLNISPNDLLSSLDISSDSCPIDCVQFLLDQGANINHCTLNNFPVLHKAVQDLRRRELVRTLLARKAKTEGALELAIMSNVKENVKILLDHRVAYDQRHVELAKKKFPEVVAMLQEEMIP